MKRFDRKIMAVVFTAGTLLLFGSGCETMQLRSSASDKQLKQDIATARREVSYCTKQVRGLNNRHRLLQQDYSTLVGRFTELEQQLVQLKSNNAELQRNLIKLSQALQLEAKTRDASIKSMAKNIVKQTSAAINSSQQSGHKGAKHSMVPVGTGDFYKYKVQRGATLSAIAKAYKVKVSDIRRVNRLKSDNIRTGQTLYIPKK